MARGLGHDDPECFVDPAGGDLIEVLGGRTRDVAVHAFGLDGHPYLALAIEACDVESVLVVEVVVRNHLGDWRLWVCHVGCFEVLSGYFDGEDVLARLFEVTRTVAVVDALAVGFSDDASALGSHGVEAVGVVCVVT